MLAVKEKLLGFIEDDLAIPVDDLTDDELLFSSGLVDSFALVSLMMFIETEFGFRIAPTEVNLANFDSIERIAGFIDRSLEQNGQKIPRSA